MTCLHDSFVRSSHQKYLALHFSPLPLRCIKDCIKIYIIFLFQICKYFLDALESNKYGWFWACPNGGTECKYKHALPPGFTLKKVTKPVSGHQHCGKKRLTLLKELKLIKEVNLFFLYYFRFRYPVTSICTLELFDHLRIRESLSQSIYSGVVSLFVLHPGVLGILGQYLRDPRCIRVLIVVI